jgi:hypothetical protein
MDFLGALSVRMSGMRPSETSGKPPRVRGTLTPGR